MNIYILIEKRNWKEISSVDSSYKNKNSSYNEGNGFLYRIIQTNILVILPQSPTISPTQLLGELRKLVSNRNFRICKIYYSITHSPLENYANDWINPNIGQVIQKDSESIFGSDGIKDAFLNGKLDIIERDPLIVVFTLEGTTPEDYPEWDKAKKLLSNNKAKAFNYNSKREQIEQSSTTDSPRIIEFKTDTYTILFVKENGLAIKDNKVSADELLNKILNKWKNQLNLNKEDIYVAVHALNKYIKDKKLFEDRAHICNFHHIDDEPYRSFCNLLVEVIENINKGNSRKAEENCGEIIEKIKLLENISIMQEISRLIHRIAHIFLPLDIDLMGIKEVKEGQKDENKVIEYLKEVLQGKDDRYYRQKLAVLQYVVAGEHIDFSQANGGIEYENSKIKKCSPVKPQDTQNLLPDDKSIYDLILESDKKEDVIDSKEWRKLKLLVGLEITNNANEKNPTNKIYKPVEYEKSPILQFMCRLDSKIKKYKENNNSIDKNDVEGILNCFKNWEIEKKKINSFHDWFCALMDCLDELKKILEEKDM